MYRWLHKSADAFRGSCKRDYFLQFAKDMLFYCSSRCTRRAFRYIIPRVIIHFYSSFFPVYVSMHADIFPVLFLYASSSCNCFSDFFFHLLSSLSLFIRVTLRLLLFSRLHPTHLPAPTRVTRDSVFPSLQRSRSHRHQPWDTTVWGVSIAYIVSPCVSSCPEVSKSFLPTSHPPSLQPFSFSSVLLVFLFLRVIPQTPARFQRE